MLELEKEAILRDANVQLYVKNPPNKEEIEESKTIFMHIIYLFIKIILLDKGEEIIAENYDYKAMAKNGNLVFTKLHLNC